jgi:hypothetical protein
MSDRIVSLLAPSISAAPTTRSPAPQTDSLPAGLRLTQQGDEEALFDLCETAYRENGFGHRDETAVRAVIDHAIARKTYVFGVIPGTNDIPIEATLGLQPSKLWYGTDQDWYWSELLFYVHPACRRSGHHATALFQFAAWWERATRTPVVISVFPTERLESKERLFSRYAQRVGSTWLFGDGQFRNGGAA